MADSKITALASIGTGTDPANDPLVIVDVSDILPGGMSLTGTTKKVTLNNLLACSPTATLASATITGDLTVDTSTLKVDSANNRVIVGHTSGSSAFQVTNAGAAGIEIQPTGFSSAPLILSYNRSAPAYTQLTLDGSTIVHALSGTTAMTLNSTGLGVGIASPRSKLDVNGGLLVNNYVTSTNYAPLSVTTASAITTPSTFTNAISIYNPTTVGAYSNITFGYNALGITNAGAYIGYVSTSSAGFGKGDLVFGTRDVTTDTAATERLRIDSSGNVGIGVTPSAGKGCLQLSSGINFPATQVASSDANTLDDYEEGTWTPSVGGTATYTTQTGRYVKIGNRVFITFRMTINTIGTGDDYRISGLPFQPAAVLAAASVGFFANLKISANFISGYASTASSVITMTGTTAASANVTNGIGVFGNGSDIAMSCFYEV